MKKNLILILTLLVVTVFGLTSCDGSGSSSDTESDENSVPATTYTDKGEVKVRIFKIGKADAILIRTHTHTMLIDAGDTDNADEILEYFAEKGIDTLDYLVITMFDNGHVGGAPAILGKMNVKNIIHADYVENSPEYEAFMKDTMEYIDTLPQPIVFFLWGSFARKYKFAIHHPNRLILESVHPSPLSANRGGWFGNHHFSLCNRYLEANGMTPIRW